MTTTFPSSSSSTQSLSHFPDDSTSSWFLPPTPPPTLNRPALSSAMNWLSHKSNASIASLRGRSDSVNRDRESQPPPPRMMRISEPIPLRPEPKSYFQANPRPRTTGSQVPNLPQQQQQQSSPLAGSPICIHRSDLPPIPQSPNVSFSLRSSRSSPSLKSPVSSPSSQTFKAPSAPLSQSQAVPCSQVQDGVMTTTVTAPITPRITPFTTPSTQGAVPLPAVSAGTRAAHSLSIITTSSVPPQAPFEPVLVSPWATSSIPSNMKPSQFIISLETATATHRTTLSTLTSRPSFLADYLNDLKDKDPEADVEADVDNLDAASTASTSALPSPFTRAFSAHLTSQGLHESQASSSRLHIFLDRPSTPYAHILSYLRSPTNSPAFLPRSAQLRAHPMNNDKLDALYELREEAVYLGLKELGELCDVELKRFYSVRISGIGHGHGRSESDNTQPPISPISSSRLQGRRSTEHLRKMATMASRAGSSQVAAVPESVHETDDGDISPESAVGVSTISMLPWRQGAELGIRTSLTASLESRTSSEGADVDIATTTKPIPILDAFHRDRPLPQPDHHDHSSSVNTVMVGPALANRARSESRTGHGGRTGSVVVPPSAATAAMAGRTSFLPTMTSPVTPHHSMHSSATWL
ncbi:hypothetical protein FRB94_001027 [Tulasnella sp. JGI-2019a]|nr:hypothetical protein FRB94_001027 [Tulasnella sp. JGI-2019a]